MKDVSGAADDGGNTVVRTQGEARGPLTKAISDVTKAARSGKPDNVAAEVANAPRSIVKSLSDTAKKVVNDVKQAAKDARNAAKDGPAGEAAAVTARASGCAGRAVAPAAARPQRSTAAVAIAR